MKHRHSPACRRKSWKRHLAVLGLWYRKHKASQAKMKAINPNKITCPQCRALMRHEALDWKLRVGVMKYFSAGLALDAAKSFRDGPCFHQ